MKNKAYPSTMVGTSFLLVIFIILALVSFATISLVSAQADNKLSTSMGETVVVFYQGQTKAHKTLEETDKILATIFQEIETEQEYIDKVRNTFEEKELYQVEYQEKLYISFETKLSQDKILNSKLEIIYPTSDSEGFYKIQEWNTINTVSWEPNKEIPILQID